MSDDQKQLLQKLSDALLSAEASLSSAKGWLKTFAEENDVTIEKVKVKAKTEKLEEQMDGDTKIVEGIFDGQNMVAPDDGTYPVPANYASKSKLVEGDKLKLMIQPNGAFVYKQIELIPRTLLTGRLILEGNQYRVLTDNKTYNVLYASVTFFRAKVGDHVTIIIPEDGVATWSAIENVIPEKE